MRLLYFISIIFVSCANKDCFQNTSLYTRYREIYESHSNELDYEGDKIQWRSEDKNQQRLFNLLCDRLKKSGKVLFLEIGSMFNNQRVGVIYFFETNEILQFKRNDKFIYSITGKEVHYPAMLKIVNTLRPNVDSGAMHMEKYFQEIIRKYPVYDAGFCRILYINKDDLGKPGGYYGFTYLPDRILNDEFDKEFKID